MQTFSFSQQFWKQAIEHRRSEFRWSTLVTNAPRSHEVEVFWGSQQDVRKSLKLEEH